MKTRLPIFKDLPHLTVEEAQSIEVYRTYAGARVGVIDKNGYLKTEDGSTWERIWADKDFKALRDVLKESELPSWVTVGEDYIKMEFSKIQYNLEWILGIITQYGLGANDSKRGLILYQPMRTHDNIWYAQQMWFMKDVTVEKLGLTIKKLVSTTPNSENPDEADWKSIYFAA